MTPPTRPQDLDRRYLRELQRAATNRDPRPVGSDGHPIWCARSHHCTTRRTKLTGPFTVGEHASAPQIWDTDHGRVVATRHRTARTGADWVEIRTIVALPADDDTAERLTQHLIAAGHLVLSRVFAPHQPRSGRRG